jgi:hypothetical protein
MSHWIFIFLKLTELAKGDLMRFLKNCSSFSSRAPFVSAFRMREAEGNNTLYTIILRVDEI